MELIVPTALVLQQCCSISTQGNKLLQQVVAIARMSYVVFCKEAAFRRSLKGIHRLFISIKRKKLCYRHNHYDSDVPLKRSGKNESSLAMTDSVKKMTVASKVAETLRS